MSTQPEISLLFYMLAGLIVLLLAISTLFSLGGFLLRPWFDKQERMLHVLPTEQYLTVFAWPVVQVVVFAVITSLGVTWLVAGGLTTLTGIAVLVVVAVGGIYTGLRAAEQLAKERRGDPIELASFDNFVAMRRASAELTRSVNELKADMSISDIKKLSFEYKKLHQLHDSLHGRLEGMRQRNFGRKNLWSRELISGYSGLVGVGVLVAAVLSVVATGARILTGGDVGRAVGLGASLIVTAVGLWWMGVWLRARTRAKRTDAFNAQLANELDAVRYALGYIDQHICNEISQLARGNELGASHPNFGGIPPATHSARNQPTS